MRAAHNAKALMIAFFAYCGKTIIDASITCIWLAGASAQPTRLLDSCRDPRTRRRRKFGDSFSMLTGASSP